VGRFALSKKIKDFIMRISWIDPLQLIEFELRQRSEEGRDVEALASSWTEFREKCSADELQRASAVFLKNLFEDGARYAAPAHEPSELSEILALAPASANVPSLASPDDARMADAILGGWFGRASGCLLGKPVEKISREGIREVLTSNHTWPLSDYITELGIPDAVQKKYPWNRHSGRESLRENILCMAEDDDLNYTMLNLSVAETSGREFTTEHVLEQWLTLLPVLQTFTAERVAYANALNGLLPPETALVRNPYREWIGAQIRADLWGWISPGRPQQAAELAWKDARLSHVGNGIYGEMFVAAAVSAAFSLSNPAEIVEAGLQYIPSDSRLAHAVRFALRLPGRERTWEGALDRLYEQFGRYHWVHTINNAALVAAALVYGGGDYERSICNVVMGGWDTDSNGATVGSIVGTMKGASALPQKWTNPLHNRIRSSMKGFDNCTFADLAARTLKLAQSKQ
jgi:ADP-ribosylglycohydrolase